MNSNKIFKLTPAERKEGLSQLIENSSPQKSYFLMIILAVMLATIGILTEQIVIVIGAMLIAPLLSPILAVGMGVVLADFKLIKRSAWVVGKSFLFGVGFAIICTLFLFLPLKEDNQLLVFIAPQITYFYISIIAGVASAFALGHPKLSDTLPGIAIAVTLIPPLSSLGIGLAKFNGTLIVESIGVFVINLIGLMLASVFIFSLMGFYEERKLAEKAIKKEEKVLNSEHKEDED